MLRHVCIGIALGASDQTTDQTDPTDQTVNRLIKLIKLEHISSSSHNYLPSHTRTSPSPSPQLPILTSPTSHQETPHPGTRKVAAAAAAVACCGRS